MSAISQRQAALAFWATILGVAAVFGAQTLIFALLVLSPAIGFDVYAYRRVRRLGEAARTRAMSIATLSFIAACLLAYVLPGLIELVFGDRVTTCFVECSGAEAEGTNLAAPLIFVWLLSLVLVAVASVSALVYAIGDRDREKRVTTAPSPLRRAPGATPVSRSRLEAFAFWSLLATYMLVFGGSPYSVALLFLAIALETFAFVEVRNHGPTARTPLLSGASGLAMLAALVLLAPTLIEQIGGDSVMSCFDYCSDAGQTGKNFFGLYLLLGIVGAILAVAALFLWGGYVIQRVRSRQPADGISRP